MNPYRFSLPDLSISTRLTLWYGLTLLVILSLFAVFCYTSFHVGLHRDFDRHLTHEKRELLPLIEISESGPMFASLSTRLPVRSSPRDELTRLAETFNDMIGRLEDSFARERRFTANAAHELLTPLTTMRNEIEVTLRRDRGAEGYKDTLRTVLSDAKEMAAIVRGLLRLSRAERLTDRPREPVDLSALTTEHAQRFQDQAEEQNIDLALSVEPGAWARADAVRMGEVLDNLLDNALKYTPAGGRVAVELEKKTEEVLLRIQDTGVGFEPELAEHLFGRFYRGDAAEVQTQPGSGLGLAIVQAVVHAYGGEVSAESAGPDEGSTFEVRLPLLAETAQVQPAGA